METSHREPGSLARLRVHVRCWARSVMEFRLLGVLEVVNAEGRVVDVGRPKQRALLALLVLQANRVVSVPAIVDGLWGDDPPPSAANVVQGYVSRLRKVLAPGV